MNSIDVFTFSIYFLVLIFIGIWAFLRTKSSGDYFLANRRFGRVLMIAQAFGIGTNTNQPVAVAGASYTIGLAGIWYQWLWLFVTPFFWLIAPIYRRLRYVTMADFFRERYGNTLGLYYTLFGFVYFCLNIGILLKGAGLTLEIILGGAISERQFILAAPIIFMILGLAGGLIGTVFSDLLQGLFMLAFTLFFTIAGIISVGGMAGLHENLPDHMFGLVAPQEVTVYFVIMAVINGLVGIVVLPHHMAIGGAGKSEIACRIGWTYGNLFKRFASIGWAFIGIVAAVRIAGLEMENREMTFGLMAKELLSPGFLGMFTAVITASVMSTFNGFMIHSSALLTRNLYKDYFHPAATDERLLLVGRFSSIITVVVGVLFAFAMDSVVGGIVQIWKLMAYIGLSFWFGILWKRTNRYGVWWSTVVMITLSLYAHHFLHWSLPQEITLYLIAGFVTIIIASRLTSSEPEDALHSFYTLLETPVGQEETLERQGIEIKLKGISEGAVAGGSARKLSWFERILKLDNSCEDEGDGLLLLDLFKSPLNYRRHRIDILGFGVTVIVVAGIMLLMIVLAGIGR